MDLRAVLKQYLSLGNELFPRLRSVEASQLTKAELHVFEFNSISSMPRSVSWNTIKTNLRTLISLRQSIHRPLSFIARLPSPTAA